MSAPVESPPVESPSDGAAPVATAPHGGAARLAAPVEPGLCVDAAGTGTLAVHAPRAHGITLCIRRPDGEERRELTRYTAGMWWDEVHGMTPGTRYGLRATGPWDPAAGSFANPAKLLLDPRAGGVSHASPLLSGMFAHRVDALLRPVGEGALEIDPRDDAEEAVWSVVTGPDFDWQGDAPPARSWSESVLYEAHVKGLTARHPELPEELRGTYAGLAHPAVLEHLRTLGITAIELLPIHAAMDEAHLTRLGLTNYWGYSTLSYFAPNPAYATAAAQRAGAQAVLDEVRTMVRGLHAAGIEVILDVVYNHTAEGGADGPSLSLKGLDAQEHYWRHDGAFVDVTGTGGTLDMRSQAVVDLVLASLRHAVQEMHVDGFRFDLAATLGRDDAGFRPDHPLLRAIATDPVLRRTKLIAEPWDVGTGGWQTGSFPVPFAEWNDAFRDDVRSFWLESRGHRTATGEHEVGGVRDLATRLAGSADVFTRRDPRHLPPGAHLRAPWASIDYLTSHDGFTLHDLTAYDRKHNDANGEGGRDGTDGNRSWNHGREGEPEDPSSPAGKALRAARGRTARSMMATLLLAAGTPMITAGDESGRTQRGNNNAYCQDNEISWVDWEMDEDRRAMREMTARLIRLRRDHPRLHPESFLHDADPQRLDADQIAWFGAEGMPLRHEDWFDARRHTLQMLRPGAPGEDHLLVILNGSGRMVRCALPSDPWPQGPARVLLRTDERSAGEGSTDADAEQLVAGSLEVPAASVVVLLLPQGGPQDPAPVQEPIATPGDPTPER